MAFKIDFALAAPIPWTSDICRRAGTVHPGGSLDQIGQSARMVAAGQTADRPFMLVGQPSLVDRSVAPPGRHTAWAYCHVPKGSTADMIDRMESQIERCAPGFRERVLARSVLRPHDLEAHNRNLEGGDILGGAAEGLQLLFRPMLAKAPYRTPIPGVYLCSASTPPGQGVHGMSGYWAARAALGRELR